MRKGGRDGRREEEEEEREGRGIERGGKGQQRSVVK